MLVIIGVKNSKMLPIKYSHAKTFNVMHNNIFLVIVLVDSSFVYILFFSNKK